MEFNEFPEFEPLSEEEEQRLLDEEFPDIVEEVVADLERQNAVRLLPELIRQVYEENIHVEIGKVKGEYLLGYKTFDIAAGNLGMEYNTFVELIMIAEEMIDEMLYST